MLFDRTTLGLTAAAYYAGLRHKAIANNIANADTPGYKALDISFRSQLEDAIKGKGSLPPPTLVFDSGSPIGGNRKDLNTVNIDQELADLSQNTILHNTYLQILITKFRILKSAISGNV